MDCECIICEGRGRYVTEDAECDCDGCVNGEHTISTECGAETFAPCYNCDGHGRMKKEIDCPDCDGTGYNHDWSDKYQQQRFDGRTATVQKCDDCGETRFKPEDDEEGNDAS